METESKGARSLGVLVNHAERFCSYFQGKRVLASVFVHIREGSALLSGSRREAPSATERQPTTQREAAEMRLRRQALPRSC